MDRPVTRHRQLPLRVERPCHAAWSAMEEGASKDELARQQALRHYAQGEQLLAAHDFAPALKAFRRAQHMQEAALVRTPGSAAWHRDLYSSLERVGQVLQFQTEFAAARDSYRAAVRVGNWLVTHDHPSSAWSRELLTMCRRLRWVSLHLSE